MKQTKKKRVVHFAFGNGAGHIMKAESLARAVQRNQCDMDYIVLTDTAFPHLAGKDMTCYHINFNPKELYLSPRNNEVYVYLKELDPDLIIIDAIWLPFNSLITELKCKKMILFRYYPDNWFQAAMPTGTIERFDPDDYDLALNMEPNFELPGVTNINPVMVYNHDEILSREEARKHLGVNGNEKAVVLAHNGFAGELEEIIKKEKELFANTKVIVSSNADKSGLTPLARYANGIDLIIGGAGFNFFYETRFYYIPARCYPQKRATNEQEWRVANCSQVRFRENGADQCINLIRELPGFAHC